MSRRVFFLFLGALLLAACGGRPQSTVAPTGRPLGGRVTFAGSTTVQPLANKLGEVFRQLYPDVTLDIAAGGSRVGIQAIHNGTVDVGMSSRRLDPEEAGGIEQHTLALDVIAIIVHPDNPVQELPRERLRAIYLGQVRNWREVGGADLPIVVVIREETSGTRGAFDELVLGGEQPMLPGMQVGVTAGDVAALVAGDPAAIGYVGFGNLDASTRALFIDGIAPSPETARSGIYPLVRPLLLLTGPLTQPAGRAFVEFAVGPEGQKLVEENGWIPAH